MAEHESCIVKCKYRQQTFLFTVSIRKRAKRNIKVFLDIKKGGSLRVDLIKKAPRLSVYWSVCDLLEAGLHLCRVNK
jgi:hypothetical protein